MKSSDTCADVHFAVVIKHVSTYNSRLIYPPWTLLALVFRKLGNTTTMTTTPHHTTLHALPPVLVRTRTPPLPNQPSTTPDQPSHFQ